MLKRYRPFYLSFGLCLLAVAILSGCASRKVVTAVEDQSFLPGEVPQAPVVEAVKVPPPTPAEPPREEIQVVTPPPPEPPREEIPAGALTPAEPPKVEAPPAKAPEVEEVRIAEQPVAPAPPPPPAVEPAPTVAELSDVFFDFDRFAIRSDASASLEANAGALKAQSETKILIEGHCDERGTSAYNMVLGERRAQAAKQYLQDLGVPSSQIQITSYGKERPFCTEHSEACWQSNRRAHFTRR